MIEFLHPVYLLGLLLASLPIVIHLWFRKRLRRQDFPSLKFLEAIERGQFSWLRLREIMILILRTALVLCAVLALARPVVKKGMFGLDRTGSLVLVIDDSYSMGQDSVWLRAKKMGIALIERYSEASEFAIVPLTAEARLDFVNKSEALRLAEQMALTNRSGKLKEHGAKLSLVRPKYPVDFVFITDAQASNFASFDRPWSYPLNVIDIGSKTGNVGVTEVRLKDPILLSTPAIFVTVENFGSLPWSGTVLLSTGPEQELNVGAQAKAVVEFLQVGEGEFLKGSAAIERAGLLADNMRYFAFKPLATKKILLVTATDAESSRAELFILKALKPADFKTPFPTNEITQSDMKQVDFGVFDALILSGLVELDRFQVQQVEHFLAEKPGLVLLGDPIGNNYQSFLARYVDRVEPVRLDGFLTMERFDRSHPIFGVFGPKDFGAAKFFKLSGIVITKGRTLMWLDNGRPLLIQSGNLLIAATGFDLEHTDLVYKPVFVPFLHRVLGYLTQDKMIRQYIVGDSIVMERSAGEKIVTPGGSEYLLPERGKIVCRNTDMPGLYQIGDEVFVVNVDPEEGDLTKITPEALRPLNARFLTPAEAFQGSDLSPLFLLLAVFALLGEMLLLLFRR